MNNISKYIVEKLKINKQTKILSNPDNIDDLLSFINDYLESEFDIKENEIKIDISDFDEYYKIDVVLTEKYQNDELYNYFTKLREAIRHTDIGKKIEEAWCDHKGVKLYYRIKK